MIDPDSFLAWMAVSGTLFLTMALSATFVRGLPMTSGAIYLGLGFLLGPLGLSWVSFDMRHAQPWFERLCEVAVIISLFVGGLRLRLPFRHPAWSAAYRLAFPVMVLCIVGVAIFAHVVFGLRPGHAILLGAILAPTDPVLASTVTVSDARDDDRVRYGLSGEAGINDGMAFPFVLLGLVWARHDGPGPWLVSFVLERVIWAVPAGLAIGYVLGRGVGQLAIALHSRRGDAHAQSDFLALALIALSYVAAHALGAYGFLAVFAAGIGLRHAEKHVVQTTPHPDAKRDEVASHPPAEHLVGAFVPDEAVREPAVAAGVVVARTMSFGDTLERLLEVVLVVLVGVSLARAFDLRGLLLAGLLFFALRPLAALFALVGTETSWKERALMGFFGIRGVGSLYYLGYAMSHGLGGGFTRDAIGLTTTVIAASVIVHGVSATPLLGHFGVRRKAASGAVTTSAGPVATP